MAEAAGFRKAVPMYAGDPAVNAEAARRMRAMPATLSSPSWEEWKGTGRAAWDAVVETPERLRRAFTFSTPAPGADPMSAIQGTAIQGTAVQGARGFQNVRKQLQDLGR